MLARLECLDRKPSMLVVRDAEVDQVDSGVGQELGEVGVTGLRREVHLGPLGPEVSLNAGPIAREFPGVPAAKRDHSAPGQLPGREIVDHPHETDADDADAHHQSKSLVDRILRRTIISTFSIAVAGFSTDYSRYLCLTLRLWRGFE